MTTQDSAVLEIPVWQFVRIMVALEDAAASDGNREDGTGALYDSWRGLWEPLDRELTALGESNADAFADLMMSQTVVLDEPSAAQRAILARILDGVIGAMRAALARQDGDAAHRRSLAFEITDLTALQTRSRAAATRRRSRP